MAANPRLQQILEIDCAVPAVGIVGVKHDALNFREQRVGHTVVVLEDGFEYDGKHWKSLSAIAKAITGNQWNGPLFFGLAERKKKP